MKKFCFPQHRSVRWTRALCFLCCVSSVTVSPVFAKENANTRELKLKAAYLYHLAKFIDWPESHPKKKSVVINICVVADEQGVRVLQALETRKAKGRPIKVHAIDAISKGLSCHIVYYQGDRKTDRALLSEYHHQSTLTVGETNSFVAGGGMVGLVVVDDSVRIQINYQRAKQTDIKISANLLDLASIVE